MRTLQQQFDVMKLLEVGASVVTPEQIANDRDFVSMSPAGWAQLSHEDARTAAQDWLLKGFLRDAIEATGIFLDEVLLVCHLLREHASGRLATQEEIEQFAAKTSKKIHRSHPPQKIESLEQDFFIKSPLAEYVVSLNKARTCVVHRLGQVSSLDANCDGELTLKWRSLKFTVLDQASGEERALVRGLTTKGESTLFMNIFDHEHTFNTGEQLRLSPNEIFSSIITLWLFAIDLVQGVEDYARSIGAGILDATKIGSV